MMVSSYSSGSEVDVIQPYTPPTTSDIVSTIKPEQLGSESFRRDYRIKYAYLSGAMYKGIASAELVAAMGKAGFLGFFGTGGLDAEKIKTAITRIKLELREGQPFGMNLLASPEQPAIEQNCVELFLKHGVHYIEASAYIKVSPALVRFRLHGVHRIGTDIKTPNRVIAKLSRPEVAEQFMRPAPRSIVEALLKNNDISGEEAELAEFIPVAQDICVEADSAGHTDQGNAYVLMPAIRTLSEQITRQQNYTKPFRIGAAGGIGTPDAAAAAFMLGADFIVTGSINQCTLEAATSDAVKDMLQIINVQDTAYAPAGDMFELGARVQVLKRGVFFPARANKLYELYTNHGSIQDIDERTKKQIQEKYFKKSFQEVWEETRNYYMQNFPDVLPLIEKDPKQKMAQIFRWHFAHSNRLALSGDPKQRVDYQVHCGPALGAFNQWVKGTGFESWRCRNVSDIAELIMKHTASLVYKKISRILPCENRQ